MSSRPSSYRDRSRSAERLRTHSRSRSRSASRSRRHSRRSRSREHGHSRRERSRSRSSSPRRHARADANKRSASDESDSDGSDRKRRKKMKKDKKKKAKEDRKTMQSPDPTDAKEAPSNKSSDVPPPSSQPSRNDAKNFFAMLKQQEAAKNPVGTLHTTGVQPQTVALASDKWECAKAACGHQNSKYAAACSKCGAMKRMSEWR